jgi:hypothetical protein
VSDAQKRFELAGLGRRELLETLSLVPEVQGGKGRRGVPEGAQVTGLVLVLPAFLVDLHGHALLSKVEVVPQAGSPAKFVAEVRMHASCSGEANHVQIRARVLLG